MNGNRKLLWKKGSKTKGVKTENCSRIKDRNRRLAQGEDEVRRIWKEYFEDLLQFTCVTLMGFGEETISDVSQLEELRLRVEWESSRMKRPQVRVRSQEK